MAIVYLHIIACFLLLLILFKPTQSLDEECRRDPHRYYPHYICTKYYECFLFVKVARDCPYGETFNQYEGVCDYSNPHCDTNIYQKVPPKIPPSFYPTPEENPNIYQKVPPKIPPTFHPEENPNIYQKVPPIIPPYFYPTPDPEENPNIYQKVPPIIPPYFYPTPDPEENTDIYQKIPPIIPPYFYPTPSPEENPNIYQKVPPNFYSTPDQLENSQPVDVTPTHKPIEKQCKTLLNDINFWTTDEEIVIDCEKYLNCAKNGPVLNGCPKGMILSKINGLCEFPPNVNCEDVKDNNVSYEEYNRRTMDKALRSLPKPLINKMLQLPEDVTIRPGKNIPKSHIDQTIHQHPKIPYKDTSSHPEDEKENVTCPAGFYGPVEHPKFCDSYIMCAIDGPLDMRCNEGLEYNPNIKKCEEFSVGGCSDKNGLIYFEKPANTTVTTNTDRIGHPTSVTTTDSVSEIEQYNRTT